MKKRILATLLALVLVFSLLPSVVIAEGEEHIHCLCGANTVKDTVCDKCDSKAVVWTAWEETGSLPLVEGYHYLTEDVTTDKADYRNCNTAICLHGQDIISKSGSRIFDAFKGSTVTVSDCAESAGQIRGSNKESNGSALWVRAGGAFTLYNGHITGNQTSGDGTVYVDMSNDTSVPGGMFTMYGGQISGNTARRGGGVYMASNGTNVPVIRILGGTITGNTGTGTGTTGGGAGIVSFRPLEVGGDAKVYGNTAATAPNDILLRNDGTFTGAVVLSDTRPMEKGANVHYSLKIAESDPADLKFITGAPEKWKNIWFTYDSQKVGFAAGTFFVDDGPADTEDDEVIISDHIHCLCGGETTKDNTCADCGSKAVAWAAWEETNALPATEGYFYLTDDVTTDKADYRNCNTVICLHGNDIISKSGFRIFDVFKAATVSITDCAETAGQIRGSNQETNGSALWVRAGGAFNLYSGHITGNQTSGDGTVYVDMSNDTSVPGGMFTMYGGQISGNTARRGAGVYMASNGTNVPMIRLLGGTITGNTGTGTGSTGGGAGVVSFRPLEIGGDAKVYGNTAATAPGDILLRNDGAFTGAIVVSATNPVESGANIQYGLKVAESNLANLKSITGTPENWDSSWVSYDGQKVGYNDGKFFVDTGIVILAHIHCLCGNETADGNTCAICGTKAVEWTAWEENDTLPATNGYYYLTEDVTTKKADYRNCNTAICLHGNDIISVSGARIFDVFKAATVSITDCAETVGQICSSNKESNGSALWIRAGGALRFYNGHITDNQTAGDGTVYVDMSNDASVPGGEFRMYGGEISGNTARRGAGIYVPSGGVRAPSVHILGGTITGNTGTGTGATGGGAGVVSFHPLEIGGDAKVYGNTATTAPGDILLRNDGTFTGTIVVSDAYPLKDNAKICYSLKEPESNPDDLQYISGDPDFWKETWVAYDGLAVKYKDGKFYTSADIVISAHDHDGHSWISVTEQTQLLPDKDGYYVLDDDVQMEKALIILKDNHVHLCLNGHTLTAANGSMFFDLRAGAKLTICDCTAKTVDGEYTAGKLTGGTGAIGGAIHARAGSEFYLYDGIFCENTTTGNGGAIYMDAASADYPGAVFCMYGGMLCHNVGGYGGAIRLSAPAEGLNGPTFRMEGGWICHNESPNFGGAFHAAGNATIELLGGVIEENTAAQGGGAFSINGMTTVELSGAVIRNNAAVTWGGGMYIRSGATLNMTGGEISGNSAKVGAGLLLEGEGTTLNLIDGKITGNKAGAAGGGGLYASSKTVVNMTGGEISGNKTEGYGGGLALYASTGNISGGVITSNTAVRGGGMSLQGSQVLLGETRVSNNQASNSGGGVYIARANTLGSNVTIDGTVISNNNAKEAGGGVFVFMNGNTATMKSGRVIDNAAKNGGGIVVQRICTFTLEGGEISGNSATNIAGGFYASVDSTFIMNGGSIVNNYAQKNGGGSYILAANFQLNGGTISYNTAKASAGGVYIAGGKGSLNGTRITHNESQEASGGGVIIVSTAIDVEGVITPVYSHVDINGGYIGNNYTPKAAGGLLIQSKGTVVNMYGGQVSENVAYNMAGGVYVGANAMFNMHGGAICHNTSETSVAGGLYHYGAGGNHTGGEIYGNVSASTAGGVLVGGAENKVTFKNMKIYDNEANVGAGVGQQTVGSMLIMEDCEIFNNKSKQNGAAACIYNGNFTLINCHIHDNEAGGNGGAVCTSASTWTTLEGCVVENNTAAGQGGGLFSRGESFAIRECTIRNNTASSDGGAIATAQTGTTSSKHTPGLVIENTLIEGNASGGIGGGLYLSWGSTGTLRDVIFQGNTSAAEGSALWAKDEFSMHNVTATGNKSGGKGYAIYLADVQYDGHSYFSGLTRMSGSMKIYDNQGGDLYLDKDAAVLIPEPGLAEDARIEITLSDNVLTNRVWGNYHYEGGNLNYTVTYGNRSMTDPEISAIEPETSPEATEPVETPTEGEQAQSKGNALLYIGIGVVAAVIAAAAGIVVAVSKKKKVTK